MANYKDIKYQFPTSAITSGTMADARISEASVTQHVTATDLQPIKSDISALALREATNEASAAFNLPNQFIDTFTDDTNLGTQTDGDRNADGYWSSAGTPSGTPHDSNVKCSIRSIAQPNGGTTFVDDSATGSTLVINGNTQHSTAQYKTSSSSIAMDGTGDFIEIPAAVFNNFNNSAFTAEMWIRFNDASITNRIMQTTSTDNKLFAFHLVGSKFKMYASDTGGSSWNMNTTCSTTISSDTWYHIALCRQTDGTFKFYLNGSEDGSSVFGTGNLYEDDQNMCLGDNHLHSDPLDGYIDSFRLTIGANRYTSSFTPQTTDFGTVETTNATATLIQSANTVASPNKTKVGGTMLYKDNAGTATLGTDLKIYLTANGGSNWTEAASYNAITPVYSTGIKQVRLGETTVTGGTDVRYKAVWANQADGSKETQLHGIGINY